MSATMPAAPPAPPPAPPSSALTSSTDPIALSWLITVRWASVAAAIAAVGVGARVLGTAPPALMAGALIGGAAATNVWLTWWTRRRRPPPVVPGLLVAADVVVLSWLLMQAGGPLNPVSMFFLVAIVLAALVLGSTWTWIIAVLAVGGYGALFLAPHPELVVAGAMHPEIGSHVAGMWWAFAATALLVAVLVARLASSVTRRDRALAEMRERAAQNARLAGLAALAAGAAHELSTPLGTITVAARELERSLAGATGEVAADLALIQAEARRCRGLLDSLAARAGQPSGEMPRATTVAAIAHGVAAALPAGERARFVAASADTLEVTWPTDAVTRALANLVWNGLQASAPSGTVTLDAAADTGWVTVTVADEGRGMSTDELSRLGEPFFTTRETGEGLGLGVFVSRATVEQLGGSMAFESTPGRGTRVSIRVPRHLAGGVAAAGARP